MSNHYAQAAVLLSRTAQAMLSVLAVVFLLGAILADMAAFAFVVIGPVVIALLLAVLVVEFVGVRPLQRRYGGEA
jgi:hypothetical protein